MKITKFLHSCLVIEDRGKRLLIDPGRFSFIEGLLRPEDIGPVDVVLLTHQHLDHYDPQALKVICGLQPTKIVTHREIGDLLEKEGLAYELLEAGEAHDAAGFRVDALAAPHGEIPTALPYNLAYLINETLLHPGDSFAVDGLGNFPVLALPVAAPWLRLVDVLAFAKRVKPQMVIPIHDAFVKDFVLERIYQLCEQDLVPQGIKFQPLGLGKSLSA